MGSCMNSDKLKSNKSDFIEDQLLIQKTQIYHPISSTLYSILRKPSEIQIISSIPTSSQYFTIESIQKMDPKELKLLFSFKKVIIIGKLQNLREIIKKINSNCSISAIFILQEKQYKQFQQMYPILKGKENIIKTNQIPLLVFDSAQLINSPSQKCALFIHLYQNRKEQAYKQLKISNENIISPPDSSLSKQQKLSFYHDKLKKIKSGKYLLLHNRQMHQNELLEVLSTWLMQRYNLSQFWTKKYLGKSLPKASILQNKSEVLIAQSQNNLKKQEEKSTKQIFQELFKKHQQQNGPQKTERAYNLLVKLISNIYSNQNNQNYRNVKAANRQMQQLLTRSKYGKRLLNEVGFKQKQGFWTNVLQEKYLKIIRTDLDLAFKNYST